VREALIGLLAAAVLAGCGGDDGDGGPPGRVDADRAAAEVTATKVGLDRALAEYRDGDRSAAADRLSDAREDHFAPTVDPLLRARHGALAARLRRSLNDELPRLIEEGVTVSELAARIVEVQAELDDAVVKLRAP